MAKVRYTHRSREDLLDIWVHIAMQTGLRAADRIFDQIEQGCSRLGTHAQIGRARPEIAADARSIVIKRWVAFYRIAESDIQIVRIVDGARDLASVEWTPE